MLQRGRCGHELDWSGVLSYGDVDLAWERDLRSSSVFKVQCDSFNLQPRPLGSLFRLSVLTSPLFALESFAQLSKDDIGHCVSSQFSKAIPSDDYS